MTKFFKFGEAQAQIAALNEQLTAANEVVKTSTAASAKSVADLAAAHTERDTAKAELATSATTISALTTERDTAKTEVTAKDAEIVALKASAKTADELAVEKLAALGVKDPVKAEELAAASDGKSIETLWTEYRALSGHTARRDFYLKHIAPRTK